MALDTRGVLALMAGLAMIAAFVVAHAERRLLATWMMMIGFVIATFWSVMSILWAQSNPSPLTPGVWMSVAAMAAAGVVYYGYLGLYGEGLGE